MKLLNGLDFVRDSKWEPVEFSSVEECEEYGREHMPKDLEACGFAVVVAPSFTPNSMRLNYAK